MIQPKVYSYADIVEAAFQLLRESGWGAVTTRAIAKQLGSSTMPIYSHVSSVDALEKDVRKRAREILNEYQTRPYTDQALLNAAFGYVVFARDETNLFRYLYLEQPETVLDDAGSMLNTFLSDFGQGSQQQQALEHMEAKGREILVQYTWIFVHGLAVLVSSEKHTTMSDATILQMLKNAGEAFYLWSTREEDER